jgi:hypothetical protein
MPAVAVLAIDKLQLGKTYSDYVPKHGWKYYAVDLAASSNGRQAGFSIMGEELSGEHSLYVKRGKQPTHTSYDLVDLDSRTFKMILVNSSMAGASVKASRGSKKWWVIGVYGEEAAAYEIKVKSLAGSHSSLLPPVLQPAALPQAPNGWKSAALSATPWGPLTGTISSWK